MSLTISSGGWLQLQRPLGALPSAAATATVTVRCPCQPHTALRFLQPFTRHTAHAKGTRSLTPACMTLDGGCSRGCTAAPFLWQHAPVLVYGSWEQPAVGQSRAHRWAAGSSLSVNCPWHSRHAAVAAAHAAEPEGASSVMLQLAGGQYAAVIRAGLDPGLVRHPHHGGAFEFAAARCSCLLR